MCFSSSFSKQTAHAPRGTGAVSAKPFRTALLTVASVCLGSMATSVSAATVTRSVVVPGTPEAVWALIGPFCAIRDWLPPVGTCSEDGGTPPTRTLVTRDGKTTFVEQQTARNDSQHFYSYTFVASPLPVTNYLSTIMVAEVGDGRSIVTWHGSYTPSTGLEQDAETALDGIYAAGLESIQALAEQRYALSLAQGATP
jgi:Polyketide cyclase / dehydrase and lipid transport